MKETKATCCYCGVGCGVIIQSEANEVIGVRGDPEHPANFGRLCSKGSNLHLSAQPLLKQQIRALHPEMRLQRDQARTPSTWENTISTMAEKFAKTIADHGPDSVAFYISGQLLTEDYYVFNKLAKGLIGTNNIDSNSRLCMSSAVAGYKQTLGADAPPTCYEDIDHAEVIFIIGSNTAYAHPIVYRRIEDARKNNPSLKIIVVDPRKTDTAREADVYLQILPGTDVALLNGMLHCCLWEDWIDHAFISDHTDGFAELKQTVRDYTPAYVAKTCGIKEQDLMLAARLFGQSKATLSLYCQGLNQSSNGTMKNAALINLHLAMNQIGKIGAGPFSLTGQPNAMGGREVGGMANLMSAHRDMNNADDRAEVAALWGVDDVPAKPGKTAVELFEAVRQGEIKIIWIVCTNPAQSMPDQNLIREALNKAELVIVQEAYRSTATVQYADILLPASTWAEKSGTVTNSERCISRVNAAIPAPEQAKADWEIAILFARELETKMGKNKCLFPYATPEHIWNEHRESTRGRDVDITGLSYRILETQGPQQWPFPEGESIGKKRLYMDKIFATSNGRAKFLNTQYVEPVDKVSMRHPFALNTGRLRDQWHGMSRTGSVAKLFAHAAEPCVNMSAQDMQRRFLKNGDLVHVSNQRGTQIFSLQESDEMRDGQVFIAMHWGEEYVSGRAQKGNRYLPTSGINLLCSNALDPSSKQPELKHAAVKIAKAELPWRYLAFAWLDEAQAFQLQLALRPYMQQFAYAICVPFGREKVGVLFRAADEVPTSPKILLEIEQLLGIHGDNVLRYDDKARGNSRRMRIENAAITAVSLAGDTSAEHWLKEYLLVAQPIANLSRELLKPSSSAPQDFVSKGKVICSCLNVADTEIQSALEKIEGKPIERLRQLQTQLKCGTSCGSCVPELKKMIQVNPIVMAL